MRDERYYPDILRELNINKCIHCIKKFLNKILSLYIFKLKKKENENNILWCFIIVHNITLYRQKRLLLVCDGCRSQTKDNMRKPFLGDYYFHNTLASRNVERHRLRKV